MCYDRNTLTFGYITDHDASDTFTVCHSLSDVYKVGHLAYWISKFVKIIRTPPPP